MNFEICENNIGYSFKNKNSTMYFLSIHSAIFKILIMEPNRNQPNRSCNRFPIEPADPVRF